MARRKQYTVCIERSAVEIATLKVLAHSQEMAESLISDALDKPHRVDLMELVKLPIVRKWDSDFSEDSESSWEVT